MPKKNNILELTKRNIVLKKEESIELEIALKELSKFFQYKKQFASKIQILAIEECNLSEIDIASFAFIKLHQYLIAVPKKLLSHFHSILLGGAKETYDSFDGFPRSVVLTINNSINELKSHFDLKSINFMEYADIELDAKLDYLRISLEIQSGEIKYYAFIFKR